MKAQRSFLALACLLLAIVPFGATARGASLASRPAALTRVTQVMNWFPEPEHGGLYGAVQQGIYRKHGLDLKIVTFNPSLACDGMVAAGHVDFCMTNADSLLLSRQQGIPVVGVMTIFQVNPQGILWHAEDKSVHGVADISNHTMVYSFGAAYWSYLKSKYHYANVKEQNTDYTLRAFYANPKAVNQCYVTSEPYTAMSQGHKVKWALIASSGYNPYAQVMITRESMIQQHPDVVKAYVQASIEGWKAYFNNPEKVFAYLKTVPGAKSYPLTLAAMRFSFSQLKPLVLAGAAKAHGIGYTDPAGMARLQKQMEGVGLKLDKVDVSKAFTNQFLPGM